MYRRRASFFFSLAAAAAASRFLLRIEARVRGASSVCSAISSTREAGSRSMTALNGEESARKGWEGSARRRRRHEFLLLAAVVVVERRGERALPPRLLEAEARSPSSTAPARLRRRARPSAAARNFPGVAGSRVQRRGHGLGESCLLGARRGKGRFVLAGEETGAAAAAAAALVVVVAVVVPPPRTSIAAAEGHRSVLKLPPRRRLVLLLVPSAKTAT